MENGRVFEGGPSGADTEGNSDKAGAGEGVYRDFGLRDLKAQATFFILLPFSLLLQTYCGTVGYEYMHISDRDQCNWLREKIETPQRKK